jgi:tetratricopeptide (TPR) repeat protein
MLANLLRSGAQELDATSRGRVHYAIARLALSRGRLDQGVEHGQRAIDAFREAGEEYMLANSLLLTANLLLDNSSTTAAGDMLREARALYGPKIGAVDLGFLLVEEAHYHLQMGDAAQAAELARDAVEALAHLSVPSELADAYLVLARAYEELGEMDRAERAYGAAVDCAQRTEGFTRELSRAYRWYGKFLRRQGRDEAALEMLERAAEIEMG